MGAANAGAAYVYAPASLRLGKNWVVGAGSSTPPAYLQVTGVLVIKVVSNSRGSNLPFSIASI